MENEIYAIWKDDPERKPGLERIMQILMALGYRVDITVSGKPLALWKVVGEHRPPVGEAA